MADGDGVKRDVPKILKESSQEFLRMMRFSIDRSADAIFWIGPDARLFYVNDTACRKLGYSRAVEKLSGYSKEELIGENPRIFKSGKHDEPFYKVLWDTILSGRTYLGILTNRRKDGGLFEIYHTITPIKGSDGSINFFVATSKDLTEQRLLEDRINYLAYYDSLTGLPNRALFVDRLKQAITRAKYNKRSIAIVSIDIDRFSFINDTLGARKGDEVLKAFGQRILDTVREGDTVARIGNDEFGIALTDMAHSDDVIMILERIMSTIHQPLTVEDEDIIATASIGIALYPDDAAIVSTIISMAHNLGLKTIAEGWRRRNSGR